MNKKVSVTQDPRVLEDADLFVETEVLATAIVRLSAAAEKAFKTGLNRRAIAILIHHNSKLPLSTVEIVLNNIEALQRNYCQ